MNYSITDIAGAINARIVGEVNSRQVNSVLTDSRSISSPSNALFFALKGDRYDGLDFLPEVYRKGVRMFVVTSLPAGISSAESAKNSFEWRGAIFLVVNDVLRALQQLAAWHRNKFSIPVIGITGSNGKTVIKEWLFQLLHDDKVIVKSPKSYNSQVGVPLSVLQIGPEHTLAIFEAGISQPGEMEHIANIIRPEIGLFTNLLQAHQENFSSREQKADEKAKLFRNCSTLVYCKDDQVVHDAFQKLPGSDKRKIFTWSRKTKSDLQIGKVEVGPEGTTIQAVFNNDFIRIEIPFTDEAGIENAIHCWALMLFMGYKPDVIRERMRQLSQVAMRLELKEGINHCSVINDTYNSDLSSLGIAIDFLSRQKQHSAKTLIISDILQAGREDRQLYSEVAAMVREKGIDRVIGVGEAISRHKELFATGSTFFPSTDAFLASFVPEHFSDETILLKGARPFGFERISKALQEKAHETVLEIEMSALIHNLNYYRSKLTPGTRVMAMVKAFSYGSGGFEVANALQFNHVDYLAVAYPDEGVELRKAGISLPIMVMNPEEPAYDSMIRYDLEPEIYSFRVLKQFEEAVKRAGRADAAYPVHIKLDTGMHRLGFEQNDIGELVSKLSASRQIEVRSVFSHLSGSDNAAHDQFTKEQIRKFTEMSDAISSGLSYPVIRHILNSAGISRFPGAQFDMVRLGIGLYGVGSSAEEQSRLQNVSSLKTIISQIKIVAKGDSVGYDRSFVAAENMRIATVPVGYADGISRRLSNGKGKMLIAGKAAPIAGNVCMDMTMLDVTGINCNEGDQVIVFGKGLTVSEIAAQMDTIPYEVFTGISRRVKRIYIQE